ncbi:MAG: hypothetical protein M3527_00985 [Actinomycetota bacterium]|nr:hypothetical protein [Acidimicrobiia bacterium]MDQ3293016.1 hypothetical protein [Actinomycetota bacterium]
MPKVDPNTGQPLSDDPAQEDEELAGGKGSAQDPEREQGDKNPGEQQVTGH